MKTVPTREMAHQFRHVNASLKPGESVQVARRGQVVGYYQKAGRPPKVQPDFARRLADASYSEGAGEKFITAALADA